MASPRFGDLHDQDVREKARDKTKANSRVTANPKRHPTIGNHMARGMKSNRGSEVRSRVSAHYPGWGQTIHGNEAGKQ